MSIVRVESFATAPFRGVFTCGVSSWPTHSSGKPPTNVSHLCSEVRFGQVRGCVREVDLVVSLNPGQSVVVDMMNLEAFLAPPIDLGDPTQWGRPVIEWRDDSGKVLAVFDLSARGGEISGCKVWSHFAGRVNDLLFVDVWTSLDPRDRFGHWRALVTCANPDHAETVHHFTSNLCLGWRVSDAVNPTVLRVGRPHSILMRNGMQIAQGQAPPIFGVISWGPEVPGSFWALHQGAIRAQDLQMVSPIGLTLPYRPAAFNALGWTNKLFKRTRDVLDGWGADWEIGWLPNSGSTGAVEDMGYAKGSEPVRCVGAVAVREHTAQRWGARPCHWLEPNGDLLHKSLHPNLILYAGGPHWHPGASPDRLGMVNGLPTALDTNGWTGPDASHSSANSLWFAAASTCDPALHRLVEHRAQALLFGETLTPGWSTTSPGESRALYWSCLTYLNCLRLLRNPDLRQRLLEHLLARIERVYLPFYQDQGGVLYRYGTDPRSGLSSTYTEWMSCWQQSGGAMGLWLIATCHEVRTARPDLASRLLAVARAAAFYVADRCVTDLPNGNVVTWDTIGLLPSGDMLPPEEYVEGRGVHYSGYFRHAWVPLALWVAAREGHERAERIYRQLYAEVAGVEDSSPTATQPDPEMLARAMEDGALGVPAIDPGTLPPSPDVPGDQELSWMPPL